MKDNKIKFARKCSKCNKVFNEGFCINGGDEYYCSEKCLHTKYTKKEWEGMYEDGGDSYWTIWEESDFQYYENGDEIK